MILRLSFFLFFNFVSATGPSNGTKSEECPGGFSSLGSNRCIWYTPKKVHWFEARAYCYEQGGLMLDVLSLTEQMDIQDSLIQTDHAGIWLSGSDMSQSGQWVWYSKSPMNFLHWAPHQPSNDPEEDCMEMRDGKEYFWNDEPCTSEGRNYGACSRCFRKKACPSNQVKKSDGCCYCKPGFTFLQGMCVSQSSYIINLGQPEFAMDGSSATFMHTGVEQKPYVVVTHPEPVKIKSVALQLRTNGPLGERFCSREHDVEIIVGLDTNIGSRCGVYQGTPRGQECSGKMRLVKCLTPLEGTHVTIRVTTSEVPKCSKVEFGQPCVDDTVAFHGNVLAFSEIQFQLE